MDGTRAGDARPAWAPRGVDLERPNAARVYDYYLGGAHNFAVDRRMAQAAIADWPDLPLIMRANRAFLRRAVRFLVDSGIRQFLDLGSGIPTVGNVHDVAFAASPDCRVVYVDIDPVAVAHGRAMLADEPRAEVVQADLREPATVWSLPEVTRNLDLSRPVAVLMVAVLHFVPDSDDPAGIIAAYRGLMAPGSYLVVCHATADAQPDRAATHRGLYARTPTPMTMRSHTEVAQLVNGFDLVEPGVVYMTLWRPDQPEPSGPPERFPGYAVIARRP